MSSFDKRTTSAIHPNAFNPLFLGRLGERDEPPTAGEADVAGPWRIEPIPGHGFGLFRIGESLARGHAPVAVFPSRWLALLAAAVLPGTGRDPLLRLDKQADADGVYPLILPGLDGEEVVGRLQLFDQGLVDGLNVAIHLLQAPESLVAETVERGGKLELRGPDVFWVKGVEDLRMRDYWVAWEEGGRLPDLIVELYSKSNTKRHREEKKALYSQVWRTSEYFLVQGPKGRGLEGFRLGGGEYIPIVPNPRGWLWSEQTGCFFGSWAGAIEGQEADWIRLYRPDGTLVPTFEERAAKERERAEAAEAELARLRALLEKHGR